MRTCKIWVFFLGVVFFFGDFLFLGDACFGDGDWWRSLFLDEWGDDVSEDLPREKFRQKKQCFGDTVTTFTSHYQFNVPMISIKLLGKCWPQKHASDYRHDHDETNINMV